jgi:CRISPR/Cas system CSM-associated protein Csm3 (group 7 of RAMP superfamily)
MPQHRSDPGELDPKPFAKIGLRKRRSLREVTAHDRFTESLTGRLDCTLKALTPVHVGSGIFELVRGEPVRALIADDRIVRMPGSSIKGAIRSIAEAISNSCARVLDRNKHIDERLAAPDLIGCAKLQSRGRERKQCVCCCIFGGLGYEGRVRFSDALLVRGSVSIHQLKSPYRPHPEAPGYYDESGKYDGRKVYFHGVPIEDPEGEPYQIVTQGSELVFHADFENLSAEEFCLLLVAMGALDDLAIKIGGGKGGMLGSVDIYPHRLELRQPAATFTTFAASGEVVTDNVTGYLNTRFGDANALIDEDAFDQLLQVWEYPGTRRAPTKAY